MFHQRTTSENEGDPYAYYKDRWVDVDHKGQRFLGVYGGTRDSYLVLNPHLVVEDYPTGRKIFLLSFEPRLIDANNVTSLHCARSAYVKEIIHDDYDKQRVEALKNPKPNK